MTESVYMCAGTLCCSLIIVTLVKLISPSGNTTKIMSLVISIFSLCCLVSPVVALVRNTDYSIIDNIKLQAVDFDQSQVYDENVLKLTGDYINSYTENLLIQSDIYPEQIETILAVDKNNGIYIKKMNIYLNKKYMNKSELIKEAVVAYAGVEPEVEQV